MRAGSAPSRGRSSRRVDSAGRAGIAGRALALGALLAVGGCKGDAGEPTSATAPPPPGAAVTDPRPAVLFLGDSLTAGFGLAAHEALPARIQARIDDAGLGLRVINGGRSGDTSAGGLARLGWYLRPEVGVAAVVVNLGSNDALRGLPLPALEKNLTAIIEKARAALPTAPIFLVQLETFPNMGASFADAYRAIFPRVAAATGATLLPFPLAETALDRELNLGDGVHPNAAGVERMATAIWPVMGDALRQLKPPESRRNGE